MKRFIWSFLALLIVACVGVYLAGGLDCFAAAPGTAGAAVPGDRTKAYITLGILIVAALLFVTEALPLPITAMLVPVGLSSTGVLTSKVAFSYFGDNTVVLFMAMFIIGESTFVTGFADKVGQMALKLSKGDMKKLLLFSMIAVGGLSTVLSEVLPKNRTGVIATQPDEENTHVQAKESCPGFQGPSGPDCSFRR